MEDPLAEGVFSRLMTVLSISFFMGICSATTLTSFNAKASSTNFMSDKSIVSPSFLSVISPVLYSSKPMLSTFTLTFPSL